MGNRGANIAMAMVIKILESELEGKTKLPLPTALVFAYVPPSLLYNQNERKKELTVRKREIKIPCFRFQFYLLDVNCQPLRLAFRITFQRDPITL